MTTRIDPKLACSIIDNPTFVAHRTTGVDVHYIYAADTARLIRSALKLAFPGFPFTVRSQSYSGGSSVHVAWIDGPSKDRVDDALSGFAGKGFDGCIDLEYSSDCYITRAGTVGFARTGGTEGSHGSVPSIDAAVPPGATIVSFSSYISTQRDYSGQQPPFDQYWAWRALAASDLPAHAPHPRR